MVMMADDPEHPDLFLLTDSEKGELLDRQGFKVLWTLTPEPWSWSYCITNREVFEELYLLGVLFSILCFKLKLKAQVIQTIESALGDFEQSLNMHIIDNPS